MPIKNMPFKISLLSLCLLAAGCATAPAPLPEVEAPAAWTSLSPGEAAAPLGVDDPDLAALQQRALAANRDIAQALLRWQAAQRQVDAAALDRQPRPSMSADAGASRALEGGVGLQRSFGVSAGASYELDLWQRLAAAQQAQGAQARAAQADLDAARLLIRTQVAEAYWTLAALDTQAPQLAEQLRGNEQALELTRLRVREGKLLPIEIDKQAALLQAVQLQIAQQAEARTRQVLQLGLLLAEPGLTPPAARLPDRPPADWRANSGPAAVLERRPDVQQARAQVDAALQRLRVSQAARYPQLGFTLSASTGGARWQDWLDKPLASLSANLLVPLIDWRRLDLQRQDAQGDLEQAALRLRDTLHRALVEIEGQAAEQVRLQQEQAANAARLQEAQAAERLAALRLEVGAIGRLDWLQARNARLAAESEATQLKLRRWLNQVALQRALAS